MDQETKKRLLEIKELLDSGILTQEEFYKAKRAILEIESQTPPSAFPTDASADAESPATPQSLPESSRSKKWPYICGLVAILVVVIAWACFVHTTKTDEPPLENLAESELQDSVFVDNTEDNRSDAEIEESMYSLYNPWEKDYLHDDFGDDMLDKSYIKTYIQGSWNLEIAFSYDFGFRFSLWDDDHHFHEMSPPVSLTFRTPDGQQITMEAVGVEETHCAYIQDGTDMESISKILESGKFDLLMKYEMWLEPHKMVWNVDLYPNMFFKAVKRML